MAFLWNASKNTRCYGFLHKAFIFCSFCGVFGKSSSRQIALQAFSRSVHEDLEQPSHIEQGSPAVAEQMKFW